MRTLPLERLEVQPMESGDESLLLTDQVTWESFPAYAEAVARIVEATIVGRADGPDQRVWTVTLGARMFWLTFEEYPLGVSLDPQNSEASMLIPGIRQRLVDYRSQSAESGSS